MTRGMPRRGPARPMISVAATTGLTEAIAAAGVRPEPVLRAVGLDLEDLADAHRYIPCRAFTLLLEEAARATGDGCFGLHFGERFRPKNVGPLAYVILNSPTFGAGFRNIARYLRVHNQGAEVSFAADGPWGYIRQRLTDPAVPARQHNEFSAAVGLGVVRLMAGSRWTPVEVQFAHPAPDGVSEHERVFGAPVSFGHATNAFVIERELADRAVPAADPGLYTILTDYLERVLDGMPREDDLIASVRKAVGAALRDGDPTIGRVAGGLAMSPRTLQRRLRALGTDFKQLVGDTRRRFAIDYLGDANNTVTEVAYLLGYSEVSAFNRAFKRWTGATPSDARRKEG